MSQDAIDLNEFLERVQDDKALLVELLDIFVSDYQPKRRALEEAVKKNNFEQIKSIAHSLKGASGNISAKPLRETFLKFEEIGKIMNTAGADAVFANMDKLFLAFSERMAQIKKEYQS